LYACGIVSGICVRTGALQVQFKVRLRVQKNKQERKIIRKKCKRDKNTKMAWREVNIQTGCR
jgi:hypothetical protein